MQVGDYVRTKSGFIDKVININDFREPSIKYALEQPSWNDDVVFIGDEDIKKSSPDIINLIEKFDFVNGYLVICKMYEDEKDIPTIIKCVGDNYFKEQDIKSIVTKEQFESMEYKVGDKE